MKDFEALFIGVDVGTGSVRAALVTEKGKILKTSVKDIKTWNPCVDHFEQSSEDIWNACIYNIKEVAKGYEISDIKGIGFDATCSLVVLCKDSKPLTVSNSGRNEQNIILWMDHRAKSEAKFVNNTKHSVLKYVGNKVSLEMEIPKLLWLKNNLSETWQKIGFVFDLPDYLTWRATGCNSRSLCSVVCKWNYEVDIDKNMGWNKEFFEKIGIIDILENDYEKIGKKILPPGFVCGNGLCEESAMELGLAKGTPVGISMIDAHSGGLGMIGSFAENISSNIESRLGLICGTSTCHMAISKDPLFVSGVWGPYFNAMVPGFWLNEAGQSVSGALIEHIINIHPAAPKIKQLCSSKHLVQDYLNDIILKEVLKNNLSNHCYLTNDFHVLPDFHGNRSPVADSDLRGMISGLCLSSDLNNLAITYLASLQSLAYGTRHIVDHLTDSGHRKFDCIVICGGLSKNKLYVQIQADVLGIPILCPKETESVLLGAAMLGACGASYYPDIETAISKMAGEAFVIYPEPKVYDYHNKKYKVFIKMLNDQIEYRHIMNS